MRRRNLLGMMLLIGAFVMLGCGAKKKPGSEAEFKATFDGIMKNFNGNSFSLEQRKKYTIEQLGEPHRTEPDALYWYTSSGVCYYYKTGLKEGYGSTGTGNADDCKKWGVQP
ncbi:MAG TPA: hypothetical protein PK156_49790 [Polyangium sp.]|nr:hypothetical protein [Polyangium sp.]